MLTSEVAEVFGTIRPVLAEPARCRLSSGVLRAAFEAEKQEEFCKRVLDTLGSKGLVPARPDGASVLHVLLEPRRAHDDAVQRDGHRRAWSTMHEAGHGHYAHGIADSLQRTLLANSRRSASTSRRAAPGRTSSGARARSGSTGTSRCRRRFRPSSATSTSSVPRSRQPRRAPHPRRGRRDDVQPHIILRFELEQRLIEGSLDPRPARGVERGHGGPARRRGAGRHARRAAGHPLVAGRHRYFPTYALGNVISLQIWASVREAPRPRRADGSRRARRARDVASRQPLLARPQVHAEGDDRAADRVADDRPAAVSRIPAREARSLPPVPDSLTLVVNGEERSLEVEGRTLLVHALRDGLG